MLGPICNEWQLIGIPLLNCDRSHCRGKVDTEGQNGTPKGLNLKVSRSESWNSSATL